MSDSKEKKRKEQIKSEKINGTSAFKIKKAKNYEEMSWSNNKFESTYTNEGNED